jgi:hypothetical protein
MAEKKDEDCGCTSKRWTLFLVLLLGIGFGITGASLGGALLGVIGKWLFAIIGAALGALAGYNFKPKGFGDLFLWRKKLLFWRKKK